MPGEEFAEGGGPAAIRDLETPRHLRIGKTILETDAKKIHLPKNMLLIKNPQFSLNIIKLGQND